MHHLLIADKIDKKMRTYLPKIGMLLLATFLTSCFFKTKDNKENKETKEVKETKDDNMK